MACPDSLNNEIIIISVYCKLHNTWMMIFKIRLPNKPVAEISYSYAFCKTVVDIIDSHLSTLPPDVINLKLEKFLDLC